MAVLHKCDRCGALSDEDKKLYAQNKYENWLVIISRNTANYDYDYDYGVSYIEIEVCVKCKKSFETWKEAPDV